MLFSMRPALFGLFFLLEELLKSPRSLTFTLFCELISEWFGQEKPYFKCPKAVGKADLFPSNLCAGGYKAKIFKLTLKFALAKMVCCCIDT